MDLNRNKVGEVRRPLRRRTLWWGLSIVSCVFVAVLCFLVAGNHESAEKAVDDLAARADVGIPNTVSQEDEIPVESNQPEEIVDPELVEMVSADIIKEAQDVLPAKIRKHRADLLETLSKETTLDSIENLPHYDDTRVRHTMPFMGSNEYQFMRRFIPKLTRVRKILKDTLGNPNQEEIIDALMQKLTYSVEGYAEVLADFDKAMIEAGGALHSSEPLEYDQRQVYATAATYLISELRAYRAMPLMSKVYHRETKIPVSRLFVFYSMHLLAVDHPRTGLSPQAEKALDAYLEAAGDLPKPHTNSVPTSQSPYHENDFRITVMRQDLLKKQPKVEMRIYPYGLEKFEKESWGTPTADPHWLAVDPKIDELAEQLQTFITAAYPDN